MEELKLEELKKIELDILSAFHNYCEAKNIPYVLAAGTLLGAVRHKGFIPWDDDIDVYLLRKDYIKVKKEFNKENNRYKVLSEENVKTYHLPIIKVVDSATVLYEKGYDAELGVYIDIFPLDKCYEGFYGKWLKKLKGLVFTPSFKNRNKLKNLVLRMFKFFHPYLRKHGEYKKESKMKADYLTKIISPSKDFKKHAVDLFEDRVLLDFEGRKFYAPKKYDEYLTNQYRDYMTLPPEDKRISRHDFKAYMK